MLAYLDNSATTRPFDEVIELMGEIQREDYGNPSSLHRMGLRAEKRVKKAREQVARAMGAEPEEIFFTSGGSESDNTAILSGAAKNRRLGKKVVTSAIEHPAVTESVKRLGEEGYETVFLPVSGEGRVSPEAAGKAARGAALLSIMHVNNETGAIQPIEEIGAGKGEALFHVDMVQSFGKLPIDLHGAHRAVDLAAISGHKIHGPKGIGALFVRKGLSLRPLILGGGQEGGLRSGTENVAAIAGLGLAAELIYREREEDGARLTALRKEMEEYFLREIPEVLLNTPEEAAPHILSISFLGTRGEVILHSLEQEGIFVSTGSACSSHKRGLSSVIKALGRSDKETEGTLRFSLSDLTTEEEIRYACRKTKEAVERFRALGSFR